MGFLLARVRRRLLARPRAPAKLQLVRATRTFSACKQRKKKKNLPCNSSWCERRVRSLRASNAKKKNSMEDPTTPEREREKAMATFTFQGSPNTYNHPLFYKDLYDAVMGLSVRQYAWAGDLIGATGK